MSYRLARRHSLAELVLWNRFLGSLKVLCTGAFLYVRYSFLLISNKFCDFSFCTGRCSWGYRDVGGGGGGWGGGSAVRKLYRTGGVGGECNDFLGPKWHSPSGSMTLHRAQKSLDFHGPTPSHLPSSNGSARIKNITYGAV